MPGRTPCREPLLMVRVEKRLSVSRAMTSAAIRSGGSVCAKSSCSLRMAFWRRSSTMSRVTRSMSWSRSRAALSSSRAALSCRMESAVSPNHRKNPLAPFWKKPTKDRPTSLGLMTTARLEKSRNTSETKISTVRVTPLRCLEMNPSKSPGIESGLHRVRS